MNDQPTEASGQVVDLRGRLRLQADPASLARQQVHDTRTRVGASTSEFAGQLSTAVGWDVTPELVACWEDDITPPGDVLVALSLIAGHEAPATAPPPRSLAGLGAAYRTRAEFVAATALDDLLDGADEIQAAGLSHNLICQQYPNAKLAAKLNDGGTAEVLFLRPGGESIAQREEEEGYEIGGLSNLTALNISILSSQVRPKLNPPAASNLSIGTYDETIRFNLIFLDRAVCVMQPYLHGVRGIETPVFVLGKETSPGIFDTMWSCYEWLRARTRFQ